MCLSALSLQDGANIAQLTGAPLAVAALCYTGWQLRRTRLIEQGRFMLDLEKMSERYDRIQALLRTGGDWNEGKGVPETVAEWCLVEDYMGFFEHCELLLRVGTIEPSEFKSLFGYRIENILTHPKIVKTKLIDEREYWSLFISICNRFNYKIPNESD